MDCPEKKTRKRVKMAVHPFEVDFVLSGADRAVYKTLVQRNPVNHYKYFCTVNLYATR